MHSENIAFNFLCILVYNSCNLVIEAHNLMGSRSQARASKSNFLASVAGLGWPGLAWAETLQ